MNKRAPKTQIKNKENIKITANDK